MSSQKSERFVEDAAIQNKPNEAINIPHTSYCEGRRLMRGTNARYDKKKLRYANGRRATNRDAKVPENKSIR